MKDIFDDKEKLKQQIWKKATVVNGFDPNIFRRDKAGAWIRYDDYGKTNSKTNLGWQIDHSNPESNQGSDDPINLQPLHWANNEAKGNNYPIWKPVVTSRGTKNIESESLKMIEEK